MINVNLYKYNLKLLIIIHIKLFIILKYFFKLYTYV